MNIMFRDMTTTVMVLPQSESLKTVLTGILYVERDECLQVDHRNASQKQVSRVPYVLHICVADVNVWTTTLGKLRSRGKIKIGDLTAGNHFGNAYARGTQLENDKII